MAFNADCCKFDISINFIPSKNWFCEIRRFTINRTNADSNRGWSQKLIWNCGGWLHCANIVSIHNLSTFSCIPESERFITFPTKVSSVPDKVIATLKSTSNLGWYLLSLIMLTSNLLFIIYSLPFKVIWNLHLEWWWVYLL